MSKPKILFFVFLLGFFSFFWQSNSVFACAQSWYSFVESPEDFDALIDPLDFLDGEQFMAGKYGIIGPSWMYKDLYKVYLDLTDVKLTPEISATLLDFLYSNYEDQNSNDVDASAKWQEAVRNILGGGFFLSGGRHLCPEGAYLTATETLEKRKKIYTQEQLKMWVNGQGKVFENCKDNSMGKNQLPGVEIVQDASDNNYIAFTGRIVSSFDNFFENTWRAVKRIPNFFVSLFNKIGKNKVVSVPSQTADKVFAFDRQYQAAATAFYKNDLGLAENLFIAIAENSEHIWRPQAFLVLGRIYILKAKEARLNCEKQCQNDSDNCCSPWDGRNETLTLDKYRGYKEYLMKAKQQFERILSDDKLIEMKDGATLLLNYCNYRLDPMQHIKDIQALLKNPQTNFLPIYLNDLLWLLPEFSIKDNADVFDDLSLWLKAWRGERDKNFIFSQYQKTKSLPWLLLALRVVSRGDNEADQIIAQSYQIKEDSPAFWTASYHRNKFLIENPDKNKAEKARKEIQDLFTKAKDVGDQILEGYFNDLLIRSAGSIEDASANVLVKVVALKDETFDFVEKSKQTQLTLLADFIDYLNTSAPSVEWLAMINNIKELPTDFREYILLTVFVRNILLENFAVAQNNIQLFMSQSQKIWLKDDLQGFLSSNSDEARKFSGLFFLLRYPLLGYNIKQDLLSTDLSDGDSFGDNFWRNCNGQIITNNVFKKFVLDPSSAIEENKKLCALEKPAVNYIAKNVISFAQKYPNDKRVPEALSLIVDATRSSYGRNEQTSDYSRQAFQILHNNYPSSVWTERTPYWY